MRHAGKVAVITGAGAGLGRECALLFAREGARLIVSDIDAERADETARAVAAQGGAARAVRADATSEPQVQALIRAALDAWGGLDVMFANAGIPVPGGGQVAFEDTSLESWRRVIDVNLKRVFLCAKHAVPALRAAGGGSIVVTSSSAGLVPRPPGLLDNAHAALWLASDESAYRSGVCFPTGDGGTHARIAALH